MSKMSERRRFSRISFHTSTRVCQGDHCSSAELEDISLKGVLLHLQQPLDLDPGQQVSVEIALTDDALITMTCELVRQTYPSMALTCTSIDVDSISHLRRLVELNTGDPAACERELAELITLQEE